MSVEVDVWTRRVCVGWRLKSSPPTLTLRKAGQNRPSSLTLAKQSFLRAQKVLPLPQSERVDLQSTHNPHRWLLVVDDSVSVGPPGRKFLFGGVGLASSITAMERTLGRPTIRAMSQYLSYAEPPSVVDIDVIVPKFDISGRDLHDRIDMRVAKGRFGANRTGSELSEDGQAILWARSAEGLALSSGLLAIIADYVPGATGHALGRMTGANSLDNTIRIRRLKEGERVLGDIRIHGIHAVFVHGRMHIFA